MSGSTKHNTASQDTHVTGDTLNRSMSVWHSFTLGFAVVSPVAGLYAIIGVQTVVAGGGWFAALAVCLLMQLLVATVYAELSSQFPIAGGAYKWARQLGGAIAGQYAGVIYICSTIAMVTTTAYTGGFWLATFCGSPGDGGGMMVLWGAIFLLICTLLNLAPVSIFNLVIKLGVYAEVVGSFGVALLLFFFFRQHPVMELFQHMGTGTAPSEMAAFLAALAIAGWAFIGFDACSTTAEETHQPKRMVPRAIFMSLLVVGTVVLFNSAALILAFEHDTLRNSSHTADPVTPLISSSIGDWFEKPFLAIVMTAFLACGASMVKYSSRIVFSMAREGNMPALLSHVTASKTPRNAVLFTVLLAGCGLVFGLNDDAVATIIAFGTGGLYAMFAFTTGFALFARLTGRWNPALGELKLGAWGLVINILAFIWSLFELINIAWPRPYAISADAPWWQLWATPLVLGSILTITTLYILCKKWIPLSKIIFNKEFIMSQPNTLIWEQSIPGGCHWSGILRRGTTLRLTDVQGGANAAVLFFNQEEKLERYNMADTLKSQHTFRLTKGHACHSDMGRIFCCITADTAGWNDTVCGLSDSNLIQHKYGVARYQEHRNEMARSGLDGMLIELGKWGLGMRDIVSNINFFSKVTPDTLGELAFQPGNSKAGDYVDLSFVMNTLVVLSAAPHPLDPKASYQPGAVNLAVFNTPVEAVTECMNSAENTRALKNTQHFYCGDEK